ncbi:hypothetical protein BDN72DRAFT_85586 [Pluteus cervinus]|uniref:Uncharacterized protein n=1 Tax=Pluteus cervinus TaxID=181527 RepID=A0ACD3APQ8_9AGAR|nr:hypothetical protein BDN72DRAFT_85586 [Pluteus cervinus]
MPALKSEVVDESTVLLRPASNKHVKDEPMDVDYFPHSVGMSRSTTTSSSLPTLVKQEPMASSLRREHIARQSTGPSPISAFSAPVPSSAPIPSREKKPAIKLESLSSPIPASSLPVEPPRRLVTQWCTRIPFSHNCRKTHPDWESNRRELFRKEWGKLESFGLKKTKLLMRPDGMVIEWTSPVPVWSDTYLPDMNSASNIANAISQASQANAANSFPVPPSSSPSRSSPATSPGLHIPMPPLSSRSSHSKLVADKERNRSHSDNKRSSTPSISPTPTTFGGSAKGKEREDPPEVIYISSSPPPQSPPPSRARALTPPIPTGLPPTPISALPAVYANTNANGFGGSKLSSPSLLQTQAAPPRSQSKQRPIPLPKRKRSHMELQLQTPTPASSSSLSSADSPIPTTVAASAPGPASILPTSNHGQQTQQRQHQDAFRFLPTPLHTPTSTGAPSSSGERKDGSTSLGKGGTSWSQPPLTPKSLEPPDRRHIQVEEENESAAVRKEVEEYQDTTAEMDVDICAETSSRDRAEGTPSMLRQRKSFLISANEVIGEFGEVGYGVEVEVVDSHNIGEREDEVTGQEVIPHGSRVWTMGEPQTMKLVDQFVERLVCAFDADRSALERMYTEDSWFTYRVIRRRGTDTTATTTTTTTESTTRRGPRDIVHTLRNTLLRGYRFSWNDVSAQLARDYVVLGAKAGGGILLNVHGEVRRDPESSSSLSSSSSPMRPVRVSQVFLLTGNRAPQSRLGPEKSHSGGLDWPPFEVISHQMVVQEGRLDCSDDAVLQLD